MEEIDIKIKVTKKSDNELTEDEKTLVEKAKNATFRSYAPYSHFCVGAAVLLEDGTIVTGNNQENSAYPSGLCAERTTIFYANSQYPNLKVKCLCIAARDSSGKFTSRPISPCGACRQVMSETEDRGKEPMKVILYGTEGNYIINSAKDLLPVSFDASFL
ncbi:MAG: cytidine deaminase [Bacteroidaceae bacterium]|nr:cytidine deaminase [Bacteroidaceae bacterium]